MKTLEVQLNYLVERLAKHPTFTFSLLAAFFFLVMNLIIPLTASASIWWLVGGIVALGIFIEGLIAIFF